MGTYVRELSNALLNYTDISIYLISYSNSDYREFSIETISERYHKVNIPLPNQPFPRSNKFEERYASVVVNLLSEVIPENEDIIFQMNYIDDLPIVKKIKERYQYPVISIVHFAQWQQLFNGNRQKLKALNIDNPTNNIEYTLNREKEMYQVSDHIVSVTHYMKGFLINEFGSLPDKIDVIPNGLDFRKYQVILEDEKWELKRDLGFRQADKIILYSGRIDQCKGIFFLIDAFCEACKKSDDLRLVIIGQGEIQECIMRYNSYYGRITFTGFIPSDKVMAFYQIADIGVIPSVYDHCPYTVLEMMSFQIPLILSRVNGLDEMLNDQQCVFIDPIVSETGEISFDKQEIAGAIISLVNDKEKMNMITKDYVELVNSRFSAKRMAEEMHSLLKKLCMVNVET